jgi:hypothetical protein
MGGLAPVREQDESEPAEQFVVRRECDGNMFIQPADLTEEGMEGLDIADEATNAAVRHIEFRGEGLDDPLPGEYAPVHIAPPTEGIEGWYTSSIYDSHDYKLLQDV